MTNEKNTKTTAAVNVPTTDKTAKVDAKVDFGQITLDAERMIKKLQDHHVLVCGLMKTHKSRGLATVESAIRNAVSNLDRLPEAIEKAEMKTTKQAKKTSRLVKPKTAIK